MHNILGPNNIEHWILIDEKSFRDLWLGPQENPFTYQIHSEKNKLDILFQSKVRMKNISISN